MATSVSKPISWSIFAFSTLGVMMAALCIISAAPPSPSGEDMLGGGSRLYYRSRDFSNPEDNNMIPMNYEAGQQSTPLSKFYDPRGLSPDNALVNFLLTRRLLWGNDRRAFQDVSSNEISRKRSYSKFCAFNAVSCFGKK